MVLQDLLFPSSEICSRFGMFYRCSHGTAMFMEESCCSFNEDSSLHSDTYFNSFSIGKWKKYTVINNLQLRVVTSGEFSLHVRHAQKINNQIIDKIVAEKHLLSEGKEEFTVDIPLWEDAGIYYFHLRALSEKAYFYGGAYETRVDESTLPDVKLAIGICTFRREKYITHNLETLTSTMLENPESPLYGNLEIYISDNSKTLPEALATDKIHIFPNRNLGGAGGFTRSMIEILKEREEKNLTHILLMDDDIRLNPDSLLRTYAMLRLIHPNHKDAFIGGHMLNIDRPYIQSEAADHWDIVTHHPVKYNYNLEELNFLLKNEIEDSVNYLSWWYCCMPLDVVNENNLPLPLFIKRDDIEYGLRNGHEFITLNGICVWHEPFAYKSSSYLEYYYFRNMCIMNSRHRMSFNEDRLIEEVKKRVTDFVRRYRFKDAELSLLGVQHYLKGIDWLKKQDAEKLNAEVMQLGYKKQPVSEEDYVFIHGNYEKNVAAKKLNKKQARIRKLTLNGWLLPANKNVVVPAYQPSPTHFYRAKKVFNYEEVSNTAFVTQKSYRSLFYILKMYRQTVKMIKKSYRKVTNEYRDRFQELINLDFWNEYLFTPGEAERLTSGLDRPRRPKNTKYQRKELLCSRVMRLLQVLLFWLPVKKNRVMVYIHDRKGFTCNPKYVVKKLHELYGNKLEILWSTMHPETCQEVEALGVRVIKSNSREQMRLYLRSRFFITNDAFPAWALHRPQQKWMNTWHGAMNYKHIGYDYLMPMSPIAAKLFKLKNRQPNFFLSGSEFFTKDTSVSFRLNEKVFVASGLPRNDALFTDGKPLTDKVRQFYRIAPDTKLVIFAPTFRVGMKSNTFGMDFSMICDAFAERFGGKWVVLFRNHNFVKAKQTYRGAIDVSAYHDMQELMCAADALISDYSSCLYDFCFTKKPAFVYATDVANYMRNERSFAYAFEKWPYPVAASNEELVSQIAAFSEEVFASKVEEHLKDVGAYDNGTASEQVAAIVARYCLKKSDRTPNKKGMSSSDIPFLFSCDELTTNASDRRARRG